MQVAPAPFTPRAQVRQRLTTTDVRGLLGAPDVLLVVARGPAEFHGYEGNVRRLGHIPGAVNMPVASFHTPGTQRMRDAAELRALLLKATSPAAGVSSATTARAWRPPSWPTC